MSPWSMGSSLSFIDEGAIGTDVLQRVQRVLKEFSKSSQRALFYFVLLHLTSLLKLHSTPGAQQDAMPASDTDLTTTA